MHGQIKANWKALLRARGAWLGGVPNAWRSWWRPCGQAQRELPVLRPLEGNRGALEVHQIATLMPAFGSKADMAFCGANGGIQARP